MPRPCRFCKGGSWVSITMPDGLQRRYGLDQLHFITCSCYHRLPLLGTSDSRNVFVKVLAEARQRYGFALTGYVVMPEHVHLLVGEPARGTPSTVMQVLKQRVSRLAQAFSPSGDGQSHFWEPRFYDFNVWSRYKIAEKLQYMHLNPMKRGLVAHPRDWVWSSFSFYLDGEGGLVPIDPVR